MSTNHSNPSTTLGFSSYSPIRTLEQQYSTCSPSSSSVQILVRVNANCCLAGGVESLLKLQQQQQQQQQQHHHGSTTSTTTTTNVHSSSTSLHASTSPTTTTAFDDDDDDPFSFLNDDTSSSSSSNHYNNTNEMTTVAVSKKQRNVASWAKSVAKKTSSHFERGMTGLIAMKASDGSNTKKHPDWLVCALRDSSSGTLLDMTEAQPLPVHEKERLQGCGFAIPLTLPTTTSTTGVVAPHVTLSLYIKRRSGGAAARLLASKQKYYLLGSISLDGTAVLRQLQQQQQHYCRYTSVTVPLESRVIVDGQVSLVLFGNTKFPPLFQLGWSLTDPDAASGYATPNAMFQLPLHQSYGYRIAQKRTFCATERAVESTVVLPLAACLQTLWNEASAVSYRHAASVDRALREYRHDAPPPPLVAGGGGETTKAQVMVSIGYLYTSTSTTSSTFSRNVPQQATCSLQWQRPDCMFEEEVARNVCVSVQQQQQHAPFQPAVQVFFYPRIATNDQLLPTISLAAAASSYTYHQNARTMPHHVVLGNVRMTVRVASWNTNSGYHPLDGGSTMTPGVPNNNNNNDDEQEDYWQAILPLEAYVVTTQGGETASGPVQIPVYNKSGQPMATMVMALQVVMPPTTTTTTSNSTIKSARGGLVSCVGLDTLLEDSGALPILDYDKEDSTTICSSSTMMADPAVIRRRQQQLKTMGLFITHPYLQHHVRGLRSVHVKQFEQRAKQYAQVLSFGCCPQQEQIPSHQDKTPKPFRPSSSRLEELLSGIPFNVHVHSLSMESTTCTAAPAAATPNNEEGALFHNVTCGAPSDHARGFGNIISSTNGTDGANVSPVGPVSGGLRRLEAKRLELAKAVQDAQTRLLTAVGAWLVQQRQQSPNQAVHYIPVSHGELSALRWNVFQATQALHHVTWTCAVRRANVFSQTLGIAITSYLTAVSDVHKAAWPDLWVRHGYLITFEGLLSAAGKELGMIEDASVGIAMLKMVSVVLVPDNGNLGGGCGGGGGERVAIPNSPFLKWVHLTPSGVGSKTQYRLEIGIDPQYYVERIPEPLKHNTPVRLYPLLFQVGVDIRQWGANQEKNLKNQLSTRTESGELVEEAAVLSGGGGLLEDEDDDVGVTDEDVLISLNLEAFRKMNAYAHAISPISPAVHGGGIGDFSATAAANQIHPALATLHQHIMSSAGRMNHSILDEAASIAQSLGGGGAVFCKSGKDRTAMHVTYKSAQFARRYLSRFTKEGSMAEVDQKVVYNDATLMRTYGTRLPICEKNVGQAKYAFNALQVKFMPDMLKPPASTLAGFLKGGRVFGGGGIES